MDSAKTTYPESGVQIHSGATAAVPVLDRAWLRRVCFDIVLRMNRDKGRSPARSVANLEFHHLAAASRKMFSEFNGEFPSQES
jgi:hypothetical protein